MRRADRADRADDVGATSARGRGRGTGRGAPVTPRGRGGETAASTGIPKAKPRSKAEAKPKAEVKPKAKSRINTGLPSSRIPQSSPRATAQSTQRSPRGVPVSSPREDVDDRLRPSPDLGSEKEPVFTSEVYVADDAQQQVVAIEPEPAIASVVSDSAVQPPATRLSFDVKTVRLEEDPEAALMVRQYSVSEESLPSSTTASRAPEEAALKLQAIGSGVLATGSVTDISAESLVEEAEVSREDAALLRAFDRCIMPTADPESLVQPEDEEEQLRRVSLTEAIGDETTSIPTPQFERTSVVEPTASPEEPARAEATLEDEEAEVASAPLEKGEEFKATNTVPPADKLHRRSTHTAIQLMQEEIRELKARVAVSAANAMALAASDKTEISDSCGSFCAGGADGGAGGEVNRDSTMDTLLDYRHSTASGSCATGATGATSLLTRGSLTPDATANPASTQSAGESVVASLGYPSSSERLPMTYQGETTNTDFRAPVGPASDEHLQNLLHDVYDKICICSARVQEQKASTEGGSDAAESKLNAECLFGAVTDEEVATQQETWQEIDCLRQALVSMHQHLQSAQQRTRVLEQQCQDYERHVQQLSQHPSYGTTVATAQVASAQVVTRIATPRAAPLPQDIKINVSRPITPTSRPVTPGNRSRPLTPTDMSTRPVSPEEISRPPNSTVVQASAASFAWATPVMPSSRAPPVVQVSSAAVPSRPSWERGLQIQETTAVPAQQPASPRSSSSRPLVASVRAPVGTSMPAVPKSVPAVARMVSAGVSPGVISGLPAGNAISAWAPLSRETTPVRGTITPTTPRVQAVGQEGGTPLVFESYVNVSPAHLPWVSASTDGFLTPSRPTAVATSPVTAPATTSRPVPGQLSASIAGQRQAASPSPNVQVAGQRQAASPSPNIQVTGQRQAASPSPNVQVAGLRQAASPSPNVQRLVSMGSGSAPVAKSGQRTMGSLSPAPQRMTSISPVPAARPACSEYASPGPNRYSSPAPPLISRSSGYSSPPPPSLAQPKFTASPNLALPPAIPRLSSGSPAVAAYTAQLVPP